MIEKWTSKLKNATAPVRVIILGVLYAFSYAGTVNLGWSGIFWAIPFILILGVCCTKWEHTFRIITLSLILTLIPLYILKKLQSDIFFPANGMEITLNQDACLNIYAASQYSESFALIWPLKEKTDCLTDNSMPDVKEKKILINGTKFTIQKTLVTHGDFGEDYGVLLPYNSTPITYQPPATHSATGLFATIFNLENGKILIDDELRQPFFYYPSQLMNWPIFPLALISLINSLEFNIKETLK